MGSGLPSGLPAKEGRARTSRIVGIALACCLAGGLLASCGSAPSATLTKTAARHGVRVTLHVDGTRVVAGGQLGAVLTIKNATGRTLSIPSCPNNGTFQVGLANRQVQFSPGNGLVLCGMTIRPGRSFVVREQIQASYDGCGGQGVPLCLPGRDPIPSLPPGRYRTTAEWQQVPEVIPQPPSFTVTVFEIPSVALREQQEQWPERVHLAHLGFPGGPRRIGTVEPMSEWGWSSRGGACYKTHCWSLALIDEVAYVLASGVTESRWEIASPPLWFSTPAAWSSALAHGYAPVLQLSGAETLTVLVGNAFYLSPNGGARWYESRQFGAVVSFVATGPPAGSPGAPYELTASASEGSNAVAVYESSTGLEWHRAPSGVLPDLSGIRPSGLPTLMKFLGLRDRIYHSTVCGGPRAPMRSWPLRTVQWQFPAPYAHVSRSALVQVHVTTKCTILAG